MQQAVDGDIAFDIQIYNESVLSICHKILFLGYVNVTIKKYFSAKLLYILAAKLILMQTTFFTGQQLVI